MQIMGLSLFNLEFPSPAGRFLLFTTKVMNRTFPSKIYLIFFLDTANLEFFYVTRIGCGIAGFRDRDIAPLFRKAIGVENICLPKSFADIIG